MPQQLRRTLRGALVSLLLLVGNSDAFAPTATFGRRRSSCRPRPLPSSVGGNGGGSPPPEEGGNGDWEEIFGEESENLRKAREYMSENALPINHDLEGDLEDDPPPSDNENETGDSSSMVRKPQFFADDSSPSKEALASNPYLAVVSKLSPSEMISRFTSTAHPRVQNAVRSTVLSLIGGLPKMAFDTTTITTGQRLASLMFQLQMTGYMFKNAEYRLSLQQSLGFSDFDAVEGSKFLLSGSEDGGNQAVDPLTGKLKGKIRIRYGVKKDEKAEPVKEASDESEETDENADFGGVEMEVDAEAYMSELRSEVSQLRDELMTGRKEKEEALRKDLLVYIRTLPEKELRDLTSTMSQDVLVGMKGLVNAVMSGIGEGQIGPDTVTEQSGEAMAQLCMWQLVVGYNLRTLEVREEMKKSLLEGSAPDEPFGVDHDSTDGAFE